MTTFDAIPLVAAAPAGSGAEPRPAATALTAAATTSGDDCSPVLDRALGADPAATGTGPVSQPARPADDGAGDTITDPAAVDPAGPHHPATSGPGTGKLGAAGTHPLGPITHGAVTHSAVTHSAVTHGAVTHGPVAHGPVIQDSVGRGIGEDAGTAADRAATAGTAAPTGRVTAGHGVTDGPIVSPASGNDGTPTDDAATSGPVPGLRYLAALGPAGRAPAPTLTQAPTPTLTQTPTPTPSVVQGPGAVRVGPESSATGDAADEPTDLTGPPVAAEALESEVLSPPAPPSATAAAAPTDPVAGSTAAPTGPDPTVPPVAPPPPHPSASSPPPSPEAPPSSLTAEAVGGRPVAPTTEAASVAAASTVSDGLRPADRSIGRVASANHTGEAHTGEAHTGQAPAGPDHATVRTDGPIEERSVPEAAATTDRIDSDPSDPVPTGPTVTGDGRPTDRPDPSAIDGVAATGGLGSATADPAPTGRSDAAGRPETTAGEERTETTPSTIDADRTRHEAPAGGRSGERQAVTAETAETAGGQPLDPGRVEGDRNGEQRPVAPVAGAGPTEGTIRPASTDPVVADGATSAPATGATPLAGPTDGGPLEPAIPGPAPTAATAPSDTGAAGTDAAPVIDATTTVGVERPATAESASTAAPTSAPMAESERAELWAQVERAFRRIRTTGADHDLRLRLNPAGLGELVVQVRTDGEQLSVRLAATSAATQQALLGEQHRLSAELSRAGIDAGPIEVDLLGGRGADTDRGPGGGAAGRSGQGADTGPDGRPGAAIRQAVGDEPRPIEANTPGPTPWDRFRRPQRLAAPGASLVDMTL